MPRRNSPTKCSLHQTVSAALARFQEQFAARRIEIENQIPDSLPALQVDKPKFCRLFELLLKDELAMLPAGSRITFSAELQNAGAKPEIVVQITDNGPGLPQEALRVVFDPFVVRGSVPSEYGINLMACFFIVHHHGGKIEAQSQPGHGTTFTLRLPLKPEPRCRGARRDGFSPKSAAERKSLGKTARQRIDFPVFAKKSASGLQDSIDLWA